jgi:hydrogenase-4 component B
MGINVFVILLATSVLVLVAPKKLKWHSAFALQIAFAAYTSWLAVSVLFNGSETLNLPFFELWGNMVHLVIDPLSAFFVLVVNFTAVTCGLYAYGYLKPYAIKKSSTEMGLHLFSFLWLHISMLLVCLLRDGLAFLIAWELMSVSSFLLVLFDSEKKETVKIGLSYLVQMHVGLVFIMAALIIASAVSGGEFSFDGLTTFFSQHSSFPLFLLFFIGFGIKAGFMPLHTWLPHAHPAAPSHVSGLMSGVMIKMGIYGILRVLTYIHSDLLIIGIFILTMSLISGLLGVIYAIVQHDLKKLLAYHSIENIGIIGIGIGIGLVGVSLDIPILAALGFTGGVLHVLNHSLFKTLLFFAAGSVYQQTHTREIEALGGIIKKMPKTSFFFLLGALAICGLPPFNGFVSEFLLYLGLFDGLQQAGFFSDLIILSSFAGLTLIGGLAIFCFTKVFSIVFLGTPRSDLTKNAEEVGNSMLVSKALIGIFILAIGFSPVFFMEMAGKVAGMFVQDISLLSNGTASLLQVSNASIIFIVVIVLLFLIRSIQQKRVKVEYGPTWGCGYSGANPAVHQYTATSYADQYQDLAKPLLNQHKHYDSIEEDEIFPGEREFESHTTDLIEDKLIDPSSGIFLEWAEKMAVFQTGKIQHYVLYGFLFMALIFCLTLFNLI